MRSGRGRPFGRVGLLLAAVAPALTLTLVPQPASAQPAPPAQTQLRTQAQVLGDGQGAGREQDHVPGVERYLDSVRGNPAALRQFLFDLPKGGDLHTHLPGAVSVELLIHLAAGDGMCIDTVTYTAGAGPCGGTRRPAADAETDPVFRTQVIGAWSMEGFVPSPSESGHDHFFATFFKVGAIVATHSADMAAEVVQKAAVQHEVYMESMTLQQFPAIIELAQRVTPSTDFAAMRAQVLAGGDMARIVAAARAELDADQARYRSLLHCGTPQALAGCDVVLRWIHTVLREFPPNVVFTSMVAGFELAEADSRYVAVNMVQPEDGPISQRDYHLHMQMLDYLRGVYHRSHITLHAGELTPALSPPADLRFHIREAILLGHAERIGHGVDVLGEDNPQQLLHLMATRHVMVESPLVSNAQILEVSGPDHPFPVYRQFHVPIALATDDEGVSRTDMTAQFEMAVNNYQLSYRDLVELTRTSLEHAFLPGASLWRAPDDFRPALACAHDLLGGPQPSPSCGLLLAGSAKAALQWRQESLLRAFELRYDQAAA